MSHEERELERILRKEDEANRKLDTIISLLTPTVVPAQGFTISELNPQGAIMAILGIQLGAVGQFTGVPAPAGSALQTGSVPTWSADDTSVSLTASADGSAVAVQTTTSDTATSFNLTQSGVSSNGAAIATTVNVPLLSAAPVPATGFLINQIS